MASQQPEGLDGADTFVEETALTLIGDEACAFLSQSSALSTLKAVRLRDCHDVDLINLTRTLQSAPSSTVALILDKHAGAHLSAAGYRALVALRLSSITLNELPLSRHIAQILSLSATPLSIKLSPRPDGESDVYALSLIPTLQSLDVGGHHVSGASLSAFASHRALTELRFGTISGRVLAQVLDNPTLRSLSANIIGAEEAEAFAALADNRTLTSLKLGHVSKPEHLAILSRNTSLISLELELSPAARAGVPALSNMPTLSTLSLSVTGDDIRLTLAHVRELCAKTYDVLRFTMVEIVPQALMHIAATKTKSLTLDYCFFLTDQVVSALAANPQIETLSVIGCVNKRQAMRLAGMPSLKKLTVDFSSDAAIDASAQFKQSWVRAGKSLANLGLTVLEDEPFEDDAAFL